MFNLLFSVDRSQDLFRNVPRLRDLSRCGRASEPCTSGLVSDRVVEEMPGDGNAPPHPASQLYPHRVGFPLHAPQSYRNPHLLARKLRFPRSASTLLATVRCGSERGLLHQIALIFIAIFDSFNIFKISARSPPVIYQISFSLL